MDKIKIHSYHDHGKASERYVSVTFTYEGGEKWEGWIPIEYRRTGTYLQTDEVADYLQQVYPHYHPKSQPAWLTEQEKFWKGKPNAYVTKAIFDKLAEFKWCCTSCSFENNTNPARRYQDIKEFGYTIATDKSRYCDDCRVRRTHLLLNPMPRGGISGYESWSPELRDYIVKIHRAYDAYEAKQGNSSSLLPDHKFPEIRWDESTRRNSLDHLKDTDILKEFQLMTNQRNLQKREVCRHCFQTGKRGFPFGIEFYYKGNKDWPSTIAKIGKQAEQGCIGCGWHDLIAWREAIHKRLNTR